jgi:hypothetical protein
VRNNDGAFDDVLKLGYVAGPVVLLCSFHFAGWNIRGRNVKAQARLADECPSVTAIVGPSERRELYDVFAFKKHPDDLEGLMMFTFSREVSQTTPVQM